MIFAALVDADRLDTAHWPDAVPSERLLDAARLLQLAEMERKRKRKGSDDTDANRELNLLRNLQRYMVNVVRRDFELLLGQKHLRELLPNLDLHVLKSGHYHLDLGLLVNRARPLEDYLQ
ncbi:MAG: hypothetical protein HY735_14910 [Verrucomicrobia bacterium]|nr:hypothetical protein [Verrucomicrobiota bacterium]